MNKKEFVIGIQARSTSTRFHAKCLQPLNGRAIWKWVYDECVGTGIDTRMLLPLDDQGMIMDCINASALFQLGESPLHRFRQFSDSFGRPMVIRITADCPLINRWMILDMAEKMSCKNIPFMYNEIDGMDVQIAHTDIFSYGDTYLDDEHVFNMEKLKEHDLYTKYDMHLSVDTREQYEKIKQMVEGLS
jgi:spore coat polysaccharide biosynthesis protein SpsF (cytidylyltransferase family)